jgi:hypothetical protein
MTDTSYALSVSAGIVFAVALLCAAIISASTALSRHQQLWPRLRAPALAAYAEPLIDLLQTSVVLGFGRVSSASFATYTDTLSWTLWHRKSAFALAQMCELARSDFVVGYVFTVLISWAVIGTFFYFLKISAPREVLANAHALFTAVFSSQLVGAGMTLGAGAASECAISVLLGLLMFIVVTPAAVLPPTSALCSIQRKQLVSFSSQVAQAEPTKLLPQAGIWTVREQDTEQQLQNWGFLLHMHTSISAALSSFVIRCCRRVAIGIAGGATLAATGARPTVPASVVIVCCVIEAIYVLLRRPNSSIGMNAATAVSLTAQFIAACLMLASIDPPTTAAADAAMWLLFVCSILLSSSTAVAVFFSLPLIPESWRASQPKLSSNVTTNSPAKPAGNFSSILPSASPGSPPAVSGSGSSNSEKLSGMSLTVSILQFKQLLGDLPQHHLLTVLGPAGTLSIV